MYTYKHVHKQREGMIQTNKQHLSFCIKCKRVAIIAGEGLVKLWSIQISYASHLTKTLNICNISNAWTHLGFVIISQKFHGSWFIWYIVSKMRCIRDITTSVLGLRTCGGFTQMNLNKLRVLFHWNQIFFFRKSQLHCLPFPALLMRISCICSHCIAIFTGWCTHRLHAQLCFLSTSSYSVTLLAKNCVDWQWSFFWVVGLLQVRYNTNSSFACFMNFRTSSSVFVTILCFLCWARKDQYWLYFYSIHSCLWHISKGTCIHIIAECNM